MLSFPIKANQLAVHKQTKKGEKVMKNHKNLVFLMTVILAVFSMLVFTGCDDKKSDGSSSTTTGADSSGVSLDVSEASDDEGHDGDSGDESGSTKDYFGGSEKSDEYYRKNVNDGAKSIINEWMKENDFLNARALVASYPDMRLKIGGNHKLRYCGVDFIGFDPADKYHLWYRQAKKKEVKTEILTADFASKRYFSIEDMDRYTLADFIYTYLGDEEIEALDNVKEKFRR